MIPADSYILQQASYRASLLIASAVFRRDDWEDLRQELVLDCLRRSPKFDIARGNWQGFVRRVVCNHAAVLVIRERRRGREILIDDLINTEDAGDPDSLDVLKKRTSSGVVDALHLSLDVRRIVESLPTPLHGLAMLLGQMPVQDVCRSVGKSRSRVYQMLKQIRAAFILAGLSPCIDRGTVGRSNTEGGPVE